MGLKFGSNTVTKLMLGSSQVSKVYLGTQLVYGGRLPSGYTEVPYMEKVSGSTKMGLDYKAGNGTDQVAQYEIKFYKAVADTAIHHIFGDMGSTTQAITLNTSGTSRYANKTVANGTLGCNTVGDHVVSMKRNGSNVEVFVGDTKKTTLSSLPESWTSTNKMNLGGVPSNTSAFEQGGRIYYLKCWDWSGNLLMDMVPCIEDATGHAGFYDLAIGRFIYNTNVFDYDPEG